MSYFKRPKTHPGSQCRAAIEYRRRVREAAMIRCCKKEESGEKCVDALCPSCEARTLISEGKA